MIIQGHSKCFTEHLLLGNVLIPFCIPLSRCAICFSQDAYFVVHCSWHSASWIAWPLLTTLLQRCLLAPLLLSFLFGPWSHHPFLFWEELREKIAKWNFKLLVAQQNFLGKFLSYPGIEGQYHKWLWQCFYLSVPSILSCTTSLQVFGGTKCTQSIASFSLCSSSWLLSLPLLPLL